MAGGPLLPAAEHRTHRLTGCTGGRAGGVYPGRVHPRAPTHVLGYTSYMVRYGPRLDSVSTLVHTIPEALPPLLQSQITSK